MSKKTDQLKARFERLKKSRLNVSRFAIDGKKRDSFKRTVSRLKRSRGRSILCIGSVSKDTIAEPDLQIEGAVGTEITSHTGVNYLAIGGSTYNVATNINESDDEYLIEAIIFSVLPKDTRQHRLLAPKLKRRSWQNIGMQAFRWRKIEEHQIEYLVDLTEVGTRHKFPVTGGTNVVFLDTVVPVPTSSNVDQALNHINLLQTVECGQKLRKAISKKAAVVASAGMHGDTLNELVKICADENKPRPLFVTISSDRQGYDNWQTVIRSSDHKACCLAMQLGVLKKLIVSLFEGQLPTDQLVWQLDGAVRNNSPIAHNDIDVLCDAFCTRHLLVTYLDSVPDPRGIALPTGEVLVLSRSTEGTEADMHTVLITNELRGGGGNLLGVTDAVMAGFVETYSREGSKVSKTPFSIKQITEIEDPDGDGDDSIFTLLNRRIKSHVSRVVKSHGATEMATIDMDIRGEDQKRWDKAVAWTMQSIIDRTKTVIIIMILGSLVSYGGLNGWFEVKKYCPYRVYAPFLFSACKKIDRAGETKIEGGSELKSQSPKR